MRVISYWSCVILGWRRLAIKEKNQLAILQVHFPASFPKLVCKLQPFPSQYWQSEWHLKLTPLHWPFWHLSDRVHFCPSSQDMPFLLVHADVVVLGWHHLKYNENELLLVGLFSTNLSTPLHLCHLCSLVIQQWLCIDSKSSYKSYLTRVFRFCRIGAITSVHAIVLDDAIPRLQSARVVVMILACQARVRLAATFSIRAAIIPRFHVVVSALEIIVCRPSCGIVAVALLRIITILFTLFYFSCDYNNICGINLF